MKDHRDFDQVRMRKILSSKGELVGVEVRAVYDPSVNGANADPLWIQYWTENGNQIYIRVTGPGEGGFDLRGDFPRPRD